jgi:hypothetical protein
MGGLKFDHKKQLITIILIGAICTLDALYSGARAIISL